MSSQPTAAPASGSDPLDRVIEWIAAHKQASTYAAIVLVVGAGLFWWNLLSSRRSEEVAGTALAQARLAFETGNLALATSELSQLSANYSGTRAAQEATILQVQIKLRQGQNQQAIDQLKGFTSKADRDYRAQVFELLGAAYENVSHPKEAAESYESGAASARQPFLAAELLSDAARAWTSAGDTAKAIAAYQRILSRYDSTSSATEAKVRLGELTKGAAAIKPS